VWVKTVSARNLCFLKRAGRANGYGHRHFSPAARRPDDLQHAYNLDARRTLRRGAGQTDSSRGAAGRCRLPRTCGPDTTSYGIADPYFPFPGSGAAGSAFGWCVRPAAIHPKSGSGHSYGSHLSESRNAIAAFRSPQRVHSRCRQGPMVKATRHQCHPARQSVTAQTHARLLVTPSLPFCSRCRIAMAGGSAFGRRPRPHCLTCTAGGSWNASPATPRARRMLGW
jgi:hypothetical protein